MIWKILSILISCDEQEQATEAYRQLYNSGKELAELPDGKVSVVDRQESVVNKVIWSPLAFLLGETREQ